MTDALIAQATIVLDALLAKGYEAWQGKGRKRNWVNIRRMTRADVARVKYIVKQASDPYWGRCFFFQSFITIRLMEGRAIELREEYLERHAEWGVLYHMTEDGAMAKEIHENSLVVPLGPSGYGDTA